MYNSVSEVVREALRLLEERDVVQGLKLEALRKDIADGIESLDGGSGRLSDIDDIKAKGRAALNDRKK